MTAPLPTPAIALCERLRLLRAARMADETIAIADGQACRRHHGTWFNIVAGIGIDQSLTKEHVDRIVAWYDEAQRDARVEICDRVGAAAFAHLADAGFRLKDLVSVLAWEMPATLPEPADPPGIRIAPVDPEDAPTCRALAEVITHSFAPAHAPPSEQDIELNVAGIRCPGVTGIGAFAGGTCIGGGFVDVLDYACVLWGAAVAPDYRRCGVQHALMNRRLAIARERGATLAFVETTSGGATHRNAARLGFKLAYTRAIMVRPYAPRSQS